MSTPQNSVLEECTIRLKVRGNMKMPKVCEILKNFKLLCNCRGWKTSEHHDWVEVDDKYHNFLWAREVPISSFRRIAVNGRCVVHEGLVYRVVKAACSAWLFSKTPSQDFVKTIYGNPELLNRIALYDLSPLLEGRTQCPRLNQTDSPVFQEFENFLESELKVELMPLGPLLDPGNDNDVLAVAGLT